MYYLIYLFIHSYAFGQNFNIMKCTKSSAVFRTTLICSHESIRL